jgi:hypothetical protein
VPITTSTGKHLLLTVRASRIDRHDGASGTPRRSLLDVSLTGADRHEHHVWQFHLAPKSFHNDAAGNGHLRTGHQLASFGHISLAISPRSPTIVDQCDSQNRRLVHRVALTGTVKFRSHSPGPQSWGSISRKSVRFGRGRLAVGRGADVEEACARIPCRAGISWTASLGLLSFNGTDVARPGRTPVSRIQGDRLVNIAVPAHAVRFDTVKATAPPPVLGSSAGAKTLSATTSGGVATGSATLTAQHRGRYAQGCDTGQMIGRQWNAHYNAGTTQLTLHEQVFGPMTIATGKFATFQRVHVS